MPKHLSLAIPTQAAVFQSRRRVELDLFGLYMWGTVQRVCSSSSKAGAGAEKPGAAVQTPPCWL